MVRNLHLLGVLKPVVGVLQEVIEVIDVADALRAAFPPKVIHNILALRRLTACLTATRKIK